MCMRRERGSDGASLTSSGGEELQRGVCYSVHLSPEPAPAYRARSVLPKPNLCFPALSQNLSVLLSSPPAPWLTVLRLWKMVKMKRRRLGRIHCLKACIPDVFQIPLPRFHFLPQFWYLEHPSRRPF